MKGLFHQRTFGTTIIIPLLLCCSLARAASGEGGGAVSPTGPAAPTVPSDKSYAIRFLQDKVAAGAIPNDAHRARFEVTVTDKAGTPLAGVSVPLPVVVAGGLGKTGEVAARLRWLTAPQADGTIATDAQGVASGVFTSGNISETTTVQLPGFGEGGAKASIVQVWTELTADEAIRGDVDYSCPCEDARFILAYQPQTDPKRVKGRSYWNVIVANRGDINPGHPAFQITDTYNIPDMEWVPITGHRLRLEVSHLEVSIWNPAIGRDVNGDGKPDGGYEKRKLSKQGTETEEWK